MRPTGTTTLRNHRSNLRHALADLMTGKKFEHLSAAERAQMKEAMEKRLAEVEEALHMQSSEAADACSRSGGD
jgi:hypothetical protein